MATVKCKTTVERPSALEDLGIHLGTAVSDTFFDSADQAQLPRSIRPALSSLLQFSIAFASEKKVSLNQRLIENLTPENQVIYDTLSREAMIHINSIIFKLSLAHSPISERIITGWIKDHSDAAEFEKIDTVLRSILRGFSRFGCTELRKEHFERTLPDICARMDVDYTKLGKKEITFLIDMMSNPVKLKLAIKSLESCILNWVQYLEKNPHPKILLPDQELLFDLSLKITQTENESEKELLTNELKQIISSWEDSEKTKLISKIKNYFFATATYKMPEFNCKISQLTPMATKFFIHIRNLEELPPPYAKKSFLKKYSPLHHLELPFNEGDSTLNTEEYLSHRFSSIFFKFLEKKPDCFEVFLGSKEDFYTFYESQFPDFKLSSEITGANSTETYFFENKFNKSDYKVVFFGIPSPSKLKHLGLQIRASGLPITHIPYRGCFDDPIIDDLQKLDAWFKSFPDQPQLAFIGSDIFSSLKLRKEHLFSIKVQSSLTRESKLIHGSYGIAMSTEDKTKSFPFVSFKMPNGELSYHLTKFCLDHGIKEIVTIGAGGALPSLKDDSAPSIGSYQLSTKIKQPNGEIYQVPRRLLLIDSEEKSPSYFSEKEGIHLTVSSPLEESVQWLARSQHEHGVSVDVELSHMIEAFSSCSLKDSSVKILPGVFISDIVGDPVHSLKKKISAQNAFRNLPDLVNFVLKNKLS